MDDWSDDMSKAPRDGTRVLLYAPDSPDAGVGYYVADYGRWFSQDDDFNRWAVMPPTHWMPLPTPPSEGA